MTELKEARITPPQWMSEAATQAVLRAFSAAGVEARFVGGAVRDALLGRSDAGSGAEADIDIATPASPERVIDLLTQSGIKVVPTGLTHGTVTAVVPPRHFEITTLRRDVETFGRHARVAFDADWAADAGRRDFTINTIFLSPDGTIDDPIGGLADLRAHRVRFVGDPATRIAEDVLRLLRYYRFEARFGRGIGDPRARAACRGATHLLPTLSAERVAQELIKLLETRDPIAALRMMREDGVLSALLPEARRLNRLQRMIHIEPEIDPLRRLAALIEVDPSGAAILAERLRFSNAWRDRLQSLAQPWPRDPQGDDRAQRRMLYRLGVERYRDFVLLLAADAEISAARRGELLALAHSWTPPRFPLAGRDIVALGIPPGERVGRLVEAVRDWWEAGDFTADRNACMAYLQTLVTVP
jgi:poly(A) polymerase